jgi:micrococcal nuclease
MYQYKCKILRVVDGDTVDIDIDLGFGVWLHRERVRVHGIDAPESRTRDLTEKLFGIAAKERVRELLPVGSTSTLVCQEYDSTGKFGRILGDFTVYNNVGDRWGSMASILINEGYVAPYAGGNKEEIEKIHLTNRQKLLNEGRVSDEEYKKTLTED